VWIQFTRYLLASALLKTGEPDEAEAIADHELLKVAGTSGRWCEAELHRIKGNAQHARGHLDAAEACFGIAIAVAERQGASLWQLRAENDLAALRRAQGRNDEVRARLAPLYASFGKDLESQDLLATRALLDEPVKTGRRRRTRS
jgi:predicted ATPase